MIFRFFTISLILIISNCYSINNSININFSEVSEDWLESRFMVVQSNIKSESLKDKIDEAQVVLLLETHNDESALLETNIELINKFWKERDTLLLEFDPKKATINPARYPTLRRSIFSSVKSWDLSPSTQFRILNERLEILVNAVRGLPAYYIMSNTRSDFDSKFRKICEQISPERNDLQKIQLSRLSSEEQKKIIETISKIGVEKLRLAQQEITANTYNDFLERQKQMTSKILSNLQLKSDKVWLIAGEDHGRFTTAYGATGVAYLYQQLEQRNIRYITLNYRSSVGASPSQEELLNQLNDRSLIVQRERELEIQNRDVELIWTNNLLNYCKMNNSYSKASISRWTIKILDSFDRNGETYGYSNVHVEDMSDFLQFAIEQILKSPSYTKGKN